MGKTTELCLNDIYELQWLKIQTAIRFYEKKKMTVKIIYEIIIERTKYSEIIGKR